MAPPHARPSGRAALRLGVSSSHVVVPSTRPGLTPTQAGPVAVQCLGQGGGRQSSLGWASGRRTLVGQPGGQVAT